MASMEEKNKVAQEKFGKDFEQCSGEERIVVGGTIGGEHRKEQMAAEHGGNVTEAYQELGAKGGAARQEQAQQEDKE